MEIKMSETEHPNSFYVDMTNATQEDLDRYNRLMEKVHDETNKYIKEKIAEKLKIPSGLATQIYYLRTRSRWSQDLEDRIILAHRTTGTTDFRILAGEEHLVLQKLSIDKGK